MRALWFMPMTYLAGIHGFAYFVPYLLIVASLALVMTHAKKARALIPAPATAPALELEPAAA